MFGVGEGQRVVIVHYQRYKSLSPDFEHCGVDNVCEGALWIICNSFSQSRRIISSSEEITLTSCKARNKARLSKLVVNCVLPTGMCGEGAEVFGLEFSYDR